MAPSNTTPPVAKRPKKEQTSLHTFFTSTKPPTATTTAKAAPEETVQKKEVSASAAATASSTAPAPSSSDDTNVAASIIPTTVTCVDAVWEVHANACIYRNPGKKQKQAPREKVAGLDMDGTLLNWRIAGWPSRHEHYELWNARVIQQLRDLYDKGYKLVIFSNQGAIRGAMVGKKATFVKSLVDWLAVTVDRPLHCVMSTNKKNGFHKPSPNMWRVAEQCCNQGELFALEESFFVGDSAGDDDDPQGGVDKNFAKNVGELSDDNDATLKFYTPVEYFGPSDKDTRLQAKMQGLGEFEAPSELVLQTRMALTSGYLQGPILIILCGVQGSGKSTFCEHVAADNNEHWVHFAQDTINKGKPGKRENVEESVKQALAQGKSVIVDRMHLDDMQREHFVKAAQAAGVPAHVVVLSAPKDVIAKRVRERTNHPGRVQGDSGVKIAMGSMDKFFPPKYTEGLALISASSTFEGAKRIVGLYRSVMPAYKSVLPAAFHLANYVALPSIALGTMGLGRKVAVEIVSLATKTGFEAFDTAPTYKNEDKVGEGIKDGSFCIVKVPKPATSPEQVRQELDQSLSNLKRKHADLLLLHWPSDVIAADTMKAVWQEMEMCVKEGLARAIGVCNFGVGALRMLLLHCTIRPAVNQVERHPLLPQWELVDFCTKHDIVLQAHSPLGQGTSTLLEHAVVKQVAAATERSAAQVVLQWNLQQGVAVVPKCSSEVHMRQVLAIGSLDSLAPEHMKALNEVTEKKRFVAPPFMYGTGAFCWGERAPKS